MIEMGFYFTTLTEATTTAISEAMENKQPFGLVGKRGRNIVVFSISHLQSWWVLKSGAVAASYSYRTERDFMNAVSMQLLSHKIFVASDLLIQAPQVKKLLT